MYGDPTIFLYPGIQRPVVFDADPAFDPTGLQWLPSEYFLRVEYEHSDQQFGTDTTAPGPEITAPAIVTYGALADSRPAMQVVVDPETEFQHYTGTIAPEDISVYEPPDFGEPKKQPPRVTRVTARNGVINHAQLSRHSETVEIILNSLLRKGRISQLLQEDDFDLIAGGFAAERDPNADDDVTKGARSGLTWYNRATQKLFINHTSAAGASVWVQVN